MNNILKKYGEVKVVYNCYSDNPWSKKNNLISKEKITLKEASECWEGTSAGGLSDIFQSEKGYKDLIRIGISFDEDKGHKITLYSIHEKEITGEKLLEYLSLEEKEIC